MIARRRMYSTIHGFHNIRTPHTRMIPLIRHAPSRSPSNLRFPVDRSRGSVSAMIIIGLHHSPDSIKTSFDDLSIAGFKYIITKMSHLILFVPHYTGRIEWRAIHNTRKDCSVKLFNKISQVILSDTPIQGRHEIFDSSKNAGQSHISIIPIEKISYFY